MFEFWTVKNFAWQTNSALIQNCQHNLFIMQTLIPAKNKKRTFTNKKQLYSCDKNN